MSQVPKDQTTTSVPADRSSMQLSPTAVQLAPGQTQQLILSGATGAPKWSSSRSNVAKVSRTGLVTGMAVGVSVITVKAGNAVSNSTVTVATGPPPPPTPPTAVLAVSGSEANPLSVSTAGTTGGSAAIAGGSITWGDGQTTTFTGPPAAIYSHTYSVVDTGYTVTLSITTTTALQSTAPISVTLPAPPVVQEGIVTFAASADHASVVSYEARLYWTIDAFNVFADTNLGKPAPVDGVITVDLRSFFASQPLGTYLLAIAALSAGGTSTSGYSNAFSLPLSA